MATEKGSRDNISVIVLKFNQFDKKTTSSYGQNYYDQNKTVEIKRSTTLNVERVDN